MSPRASAGAPAPGPLARRRRALPLVLWLVALALLLVQVLRSTYSADLSAFLPRDPDPAQRLLIEQLDSGAPSRALLLAIGGGSAEERAAASKALAAALRADRRFEQVQNGEREAYADFGRWLFEHRYALSPAIAPERFTSAGLRAAIDERLALLGTPAGAAATLEADPSGETQRIAEALLPADAPRSEGGVWVARGGAPGAQGTRPGDGQALLLVTTRAAGADLDAQAAAIAAVRSAFERARVGELTIDMSGTPLFSVQSRDRIEAEVKWLAAAGLVAMSTLLLAAFASPLALGVALLPVASGVLAGIAAVGLGFPAVHGITLGFGATLIGEAVDYAIYYLIQARPLAGARAGDGWRRWVAQGWPTVRLGLATSVCGFGALVFSGFEGLAQLGVFSIAGLLAAAFTTRFVLPVLQPDGTHGQGLRGGLAKAAAAAFAALPRARVALGVLVLAALAVAVFGPDPWRADLASLSPIPAADLERDQRLRAGLGTSDARTLVVVQGASVEQALQRAEAAGARLDALVDAGAIKGYDSAARLLPSAATQAARRAALPERTALVEALAAATRGGPLPAVRLGPFVDAVAAARERPPLTHAVARAGPAGPLVDTLLQVRADGSASALLPLYPPAEVAAEATVRAAREALAGIDGAQVLDIKTELDRLYARYLRQAQTLAAAGALAVVLLMAWALRSPRALLAVCVPLAGAVLLVMAALALLGTALSILHLVGLLLVVAVGSNYALFFVQLARSEGPPDADTLASLVLANLTTVVSFGLLALAQIPALSAIGRVVAPGALLALVLAAAFVPAGSRKAV